MLLREMAFLGCAGAAVLAGCNDKPTVGPGSGAGGGGVGGGAGGGPGVGGEPSWIVETGSGGCDTILYDPPDQKGQHVDECSKLNHWTNPPTAGPHYPKWASFKMYAEPVPRGYYVHSMEHGAVVLAYNCPGDCSDDVAAMQALADGWPGDPRCPGGGSGGAGGSAGVGGSTPGLVRHRLIILPDPDMDVPFAAAAWGHMLKAQCFDEALVTAFIEAHYAQSPEDICGGGFDPTDPMNEVPPDCGD